MVMLEEIVAYWKIIKNSSATKSFISVKYLYNAELKVLKLSYAYQRKTSLRKRVLESARYDILI